MSIIPSRHAPPILIGATNLNYEHIIGDFSKSFWVILLKFRMHIKDMYANTVFDFEQFQDDIDDSMTNLWCAHRHIRRRSNQQDEVLATHNLYTDFFLVWISIGNPNS